MEEFEKLVFGILDEDHSVREISENTLGLMKSVDSVGLSSNLLETMSKDESQLTHLSAVLYRKFFIEEFNPEQDPSCKLKLLQILQPSRSLNYLKKISNILIALSVQQNFSNEILSNIVNWLNSPHGQMKSLAFYMLEISTEQLQTMQIIEANSCSLFELLCKGLNDESPEIKLAACKAACQVMKELNLSPQSTNLLQMILSTIHLTAPLDPFDIITGINDLISVHPAITSGLIDKLVQPMSKIAKDHKMTRQSRSAAVEVFSLMTGRCTTIIRQSRYFIQEALTLSMILLAELEFVNNLEEWDSAIDSEVALLEPYDVGKQLLSELADRLQGQVFDDAILLIDAHLVAGHWVYLHSGLLALGLIADGCKERFKSCLDKYCLVVLENCGHEHPRIRFAAITAMSLFCTFFAPFMQVHYHEEVVRNILVNMKHEYSKVKSQALKGIINFCSGLDFRVVKWSLEGYAQAFFEGFDGVLNDPTSSVEVLQDLLASLAAFVNKLKSAEGFQGFLPKLMKIFYMPGLQIENLKREAMNCVATILNKNKYNNSDQIIEDLLRIKSMVNESEDHYPKLIEILCKKVVASGNALLLRDIMEELLKNASVPVEVAVFDSESISSYLLRGIVVDINGLGSKKISLNTSAIQVKKSACILINFLINELKNQIQPWAYQIFNVMTSNIDFKLNQVVVKFALKSIVSLVIVSDLQTKQSLLINLIPKLLDSASSKLKTFPKDVLQKLLTLNTIFENLENISCIGLTESMNLSILLSSCISSIIQRKNARLELNQKFSLQTPEGIQEFEDLENIDDELLRVCMDLTGFLLKSFRKDFLHLFKEYFQGLVGELLYKNRPSESELVAGLCLFCDYIEHTGDLMLNNGNSLLVPELIKFAYHQSKNVRQSAVYAIGLAALFGGGSFDRYVDAAAEACNFVINLPEAFGIELIESSECAVGALGKIAVVYREDLIPCWIKYLPLRSDPEEASVSTNLFFKNYPKIQKFDTSNQIFNLLSTH